jgi:hypothetical protein
MCVDLHTHSVYSDGADSPSRLIEMAAASGLTGFALTDHDTVEGVAEVLRLGSKHGLMVLSGIEVSARHGGACIHILGYGVDLEHPVLTLALSALQQGRIERNRKIVERLTALGMTVSLDEVERLSVCGQTGRPHIARAMTEKGYVKTPLQAFERYLGRNKPAWFSRFAYSAAETIAIIHAAGGAAVLAHPGIIDSSLTIQPNLIRELAALQLDGIEVYYPGHSPRMTACFRELARQHDLIVTGGSDYHGDARIRTLAGAAVGCCPPDAIMEELLARLRSLRQRTLPQL